MRIFLGLVCGAVLLCGPRAHRAESRQASRKPRKARIAGDRFRIWRRLVARHRFGDISITPTAGASLSLCHEGSRPQPTGSGECKGDGGPSWRRRRPRIAPPAAALESGSRTFPVPSPSAQRPRPAPRSPGQACTGSRAWRHAQAGSSIRWKQRGPPLSDPIVIAPEGELDVARLGEFRAVLYDAAWQAEQLLWWI